MSSNHGLAIVGLLAISIAVGAASTAGCRQASCRRLSGQEALQGEGAALFKDVAPEWATDVDVCHQGAYTIITPVRGKEAAIFVTQGHQGVLMKNASGISLFQAGKALVTVSDTDHDGRYDVLSYEGVDRTTGASVSVFDVGLDGQADMKFTRSAQGSRATWLWVQGAWYEQVLKGGRSGVLVKGVFKSVKTVNGQRVFGEP